MLSGPGGVGKGTVVAGLRAHMPDLAVAVSATTRRPRPDEVDGVHYHFLDDAAFDALIAADGFLEWAEFNGQRYGTPWTSVRADLNAGRTVLLEIDVQGALQVRALEPDALLVFLAPPDVDALRARLEARGSDDDAAVMRRLRIAERELAAADRFDVVVVNDRLDEAVARVASILARPPAP